MRAVYKPWGFFGVEWRQAGWDKQPRQFQCVELTSDSVQGNTHRATSIYPDLRGGAVGPKMGMLRRSSLAALFATCTRTEPCKLTEAHHNHLLDSVYICNQRISTRNPLLYIAHPSRQNPKTPPRNYHYMSSIHQPTVRRPKIHLLPGDCL